MANWVLKRLAQAVVTVFVVVNISFFLIRGMPGGPYQALRTHFYQQYGEGGTVDPERIERLVELHLNINPQQPLHVQYYEYMSDVFLRGDLGHSIWYDAPVTEILLAALPWTIFVMSGAMIITFVMSIVLGALMAYYEGGTFDFVMTIIAVIESSTPYYVVAILLLFVFGYQMDWFPTGGRYPDGVEPGVSLEFARGALYHAALPMISMIVTGAAASLEMRGNSISILGSDYIRVADLRGLSPIRISMRYVLRNALLPLYTGLLLAVAGMFGGSIILEEIFSYRGIGWWTFRGVERRDYPLMMGGFILICVAVAVAMIVADLTYGKIDPRAQAEGSNREVYGSAGAISLGTLVKRTFRKVPFVGSGHGSATESSSFEWIGREETADEADEDEELSRGQQAYSSLDRSLLSPMRIVWSDWRGKLGAIITGLFIFTGTVGTRFYRRPVDRTDPYLRPLEDPSYPVGTDSVGQDLLSLMIHATPSMLIMVAAGGLFTIAIGTFVGTYAGFRGGGVDRVLMTACDIAMTLPGLPLIIVIAAIVEPRHPAMVGIIISINAWGGLGRAIRSEVLSVRESSYIEASRAVGIYTPSILWDDVLPNLWPFILINLVNAARGVIFASVGLYFLGFLPYTTMNWGVVLNLAWEGGAIYTAARAHWIIVPMLVIVFFSAGLILLAQAMDQIANPRIRARHAKTVDEEASLHA